MIDGPCTCICHLCSCVVNMNSRVLMHSLAYHGHGYSCNFTAKYGRGGAELMTPGDVGNWDFIGVAEMMGWETKT